MHSEKRAPRSFNAVLWFNRGNYIENLNS
jgi:hypothetical protein